MLWLSDEVDVAWRLLVDLQGRLHCLNMHYEVFNLFGIMGHYQKILNGVIAVK